jgi:hypothetical protein
MRIYSLSASKIKTWKMCQFKFYLEYHLGMSTGTSFAAEQGSLVHAVLQQHAEGYKRGEKEPEIATTWREKVFRAYSDYGLWKIDTKMAAVDRRCGDCEHCHGDTCALAGEKFDAFEGCPIEDHADTVSLIEKVLNDESVNNPLNKEIIDIENRFQLQIPDGDDIIKVGGYMDIVTELDKDTVEVFDYKTGKHIQSYNVCLKDPQLLIYHLAARKEYPNYPNTLITIYYVRRRPITLSFGERDERGTERALKHYYHLIKHCDTPCRRCDRNDGSVNFDYVCEKMCDQKTCVEQYKKFAENGHVILPPPDKIPYDRTDWCDILDELGNEKDN